MAEPQEDIEKARARALVIERLGQPDVQAMLADVFTDYYLDFRRIVTLAEVESEGVRPEGLANEVYACFHHIARGLVQPDADPANEITKGRHSHLKRMALDAHKIAINNILREAQPILDALDILASNADLPKLIEGGFDTLNELRLGRTKVKNLYLDAKRAEGKGEEFNPLEKYTETLSEASNLQTSLDKLSSRKQFLYALKRDEEARTHAEKSSRHAEESSRHSAASSQAAAQAVKFTKWSVVIAGITGMAAIFFGLSEHNSKKHGGSDPPKGFSDGAAVGGGSEDAPQVDEIP
jgi:hypothetical protein